MRERERKRPDQKFAVWCYGAAVVLSSILSVVVSLTVDREGNLFLYMSYLLPQIGYIGVFCYLYFRRSKNGLRDFLAKENVRPLEYLFAVLAAVGLLFFGLLPNAYVQKLFEIIGLHATVIVPELNVWYDYVLCGVILCVLPAIGEELVFRKSFCDGMEGVADYKTVLLCGLAFSLSHFNPAQTLHQFVLGCVLGFVYVLTRNVTLTMTMHFVNNAIAVYLERITGTEIWNNTVVTAVACALGAVVLVVSLFFIWKRRGKSAEEKKTGTIEPVTIGLLVVLAVIWALMTALSFLQ